MPRKRKNHSRNVESEDRAAELERRWQLAREMEERFEEHPLPEYTEAERIEDSKLALSNHIGIDEHSGPPNTVLFFVELAPSSSQRGSGCRFVTCDKKIDEGNYRIAVYPGMYSMYGSADFYHVGCFEKLVDFSKVEYFNHLQPVTRRTVALRGLKGSSICDGNYMLDGGAERLVLEWMASMERLIAQRDGVHDEPLDPAFSDLLYRAGSSSYRPKEVKGMTHSEYRLLSGPLAPIESDGPEDDEEWDLFKEFMSMDFRGVEDLKEPHSLSRTLSAWRTAKILASYDEDRLTEKGKETKKNLGEKAIRAIRRLSSIPMPDFQAAFLRSLGTKA
ncbi:hypothetical protein DL769_004266 [Monosporascus sp. CRB-8-3]|nr:hypothetical protein DL769_004266 [Monosporascus sp. CRB-8-3]